MRYLNPFNVAHSFALWYGSGRTDVLLGWNSQQPHFVARVGYLAGCAITRFRVRFLGLRRRRSS